MTEISNNFPNMIKLQSNEGSSEFNQIYSKINRQEEQKLQSDIILNDEMSSDELVNKIIENSIINNTISMMKQNEETMKELLDD